MDVAGGDEGVDARAGGLLDRLPGAVDIAWRGAGKRTDRRALDGAGDLSHGFKVAPGSDGKARLDHVDTQARELQGDLDLLLRVERDPGRLLAVAQGRIEDQYSVRFGVLAHVTPSGSRLELFSCGVRPRPAAGVLFPPRGEEKERARSASAWWRLEVARCFGTAGPDGPLTCAAEKQHVRGSVAAAARDASRPTDLCAATS